MITFKAQHILNPAAKKRIFRRNFKPQLHLQIIPKRPTNMITFKAQHILNLAAKKRTFWQNFKPQLQQQIIQRDQPIWSLKAHQKTKPCSQKTDILAKF